MSHLPFVECRARTSGMPRTAFATARAVAPLTWTSVIAHRLLVHGGVELDGEPSDHAAVEESGDPGLDRAAGHAEGGREGRDGRAGVTAEAREKGAVQVVEKGWHRHNVACSGANCAINGQIFVRNDVVLTIAGRDDCPMTILSARPTSPASVDAGLVSQALVSQALVVKPW